MVRSSATIVIFALSMNSGVAQDFCSVEVPGQVFCDDFSDGNADTPPVQWTPTPERPGEYDASSGDYNFIPTPASVGFMDSDAVNETHGNVSLRGRVRITEK